MRKLILVYVSTAIFYCSYSQEVLIFDSVLYVTKQQNGFRYFQPYKQAGLNWVTPYNLYKGEFHVKYEIIDYPSPDSMMLSICIWSEVEEGWKSWKESCTPQIAIPGKGVVTSVSVPEQWWKLKDVPVDFSNVPAFKSMGLVLWCDKLHNMTTWVKPEENCWEKHQKYLPLKLRITVVAVAEGHKFSGWEKY